MKPFPDGDFDEDELDEELEEAMEEECDNFVHIPTDRRRELNKLAMEAAGWIDAKEIDMKERRLFLDMLYLLVR